MYHLEHDVTDKKKALEVLPAIQEIQTDRLAHEDDFALNQIARKRFRESKKQSEEKLAKDNSLLSRLSLTGSQVALLPETDEDLTMAKVILLTNSKRRTTTNPLNPMFLVRNKKLLVPASKNTSTSVNIKQSTISTLKMTRGASSDSVNHHPCKSTKLFDKCKDSGVKENEIHQKLYISSLADSHSSNNITNCSVELVAYEKNIQNSQGLVNNFITCMTDIDILKLVWEGKVPACFTLAQEDLAYEDHAPPPVYVSLFFEDSITITSGKMFLPRVSYFPLVTEKVIKQFSQFTESSLKTAADDTTFVARSKLENETQCTSSSQIDSFKQHPLTHEFWLEYAHQPLKWHYPIGLVFDMCADTMDIPWKITVHFSVCACYLSCLSIQNYPTDLLLSPPVSRLAVEAHFMSMIKEADALKHRSYVINQMQARDHRQLWNGLLHFRYDQFWSINSKLMEPLPYNTKDLPSEEIPISEIPENKSKSANLDNISSSRCKTFRYIPCRLYCVSENPNSAPSGFTQKLIRPLNDDGSLISLQDAIRILFHSNANSLAQNPNPKSYLFFIHGITLPYETPMQWISEHLSYPDNFVHIVARPRNHSHRIKILNLQ
ncbi:Autophagy protein 5 [Schistosoma japonicum]|nr:Autophagy protein 5 [Schistosoma japonicum]